MTRPVAPGGPKGIMILSGVTQTLATGKMSAWLPPDASSHAPGVDGAFFLIYVAAAFAVVLVTGLALVFILQYRRRSADDKAFPSSGPNIFFMGIWALCALGLGLFVFTQDFSGFMDRTVAPRGALQVNVTARQWAYDFTYPNGYVADTLHVAVGQPVQLNLTSSDVVHSLTVPALRLHQAALPGQVTTAWFEATAEGEYELRSNIYSGEGYPDMKTALVSQSPADYDTWMANATDIFAGRTPEEVGEMLYNRLGCKACHTIDGTPLVGPSFKDVYGNTFETTTGEMVLVDDAYIKESILYPNNSIVAGYQPVMTPYEGKVNDKEIEAITAWLKTLSQFAGQEGN